MKTQLVRSIPPRSSNIQASTQAPSTYAGYEILEDRLHLFLRSLRNQKQTLISWQQDSHRFFVFLASKNGKKSLLASAAFPSDADSRDAAAADAFKLKMTSQRKMTTFLIDNILQPEFGVLKKNQELPGRKPKKLHDSDPKGNKNHKGGRKN